MATLNLGIVAHVDAGKTSLTERLLYAAGVVDELGRVDEGTTRTDTLELERARGITIRSAVASFAVGDVTVNLVDTPGHPDFIAEVERVLGVLDGVVLVVSAVEGVQPQTRVLMRALRRLRIPTLVFVNKIDRAGARYDSLLRDLAERLEITPVAMGTTVEAGRREAEFVPYGESDTDFRAGLLDVLTRHDDELLAAYVDDESALSYSRLHTALAEQTKQMLVCPVYFGSAVTGAGVEALTAGLVELLPTDAGGHDGPVSGTVFKIERGPAGEKIAYVRMFAGTVHARDRVAVNGSAKAKVTGISVFRDGSEARADAIEAGQIGKLLGLSAARVGDPIGALNGTGRIADADGSYDAGPAGEGVGSRRRQHFAPPTLETVVTPVRQRDQGALHAALVQLAEQDPLIDVRQDGLRHETSVSLYGEVQKEVLQATLAADYGIEVDFRDTTTICVERPVGVGSAVEEMGDESNPFRATVGLRVEPGPEGSGVRFEREVELGSLPYSFFRAVEETVRATLAQGLSGWQVIDVTVTMTHSAYVPPPPYGWSKWSSSAGDFRALTPLVLMSALRQAGTRVYEPVHRFELEVPEDTIAATLTTLRRLRAVPLAQTRRERSYVIDGEIPAARVHELQRELPALSHGDGVLESAFGRYQPVAGPPPTRPRTDHNPLDRREYLLHVKHRVPG